MRKSHGLVVLVSSLWVALILVVLVIRGGAVPLVPRSEPDSPASPQSLARQAETLAEAGDYEGAWRLYYQALEAAPEDVSLWYGLGVTLSHLNQRQGTEAAFQYVVHHGRPDSEEVRLARQWLVSAGVRAQSVAFTITADSVDVTRGKADLTGKATWGELEPDRAPLNVQILLEGLTGDAEGKRFGTRVALGQAYRFERLPAGTYRLIGEVAGHLLWDLTLNVEDGGETLLDLKKDNSRTPTVALYL